MSDDTFIGNCDGTRMYMWMTQNADCFAGTRYDLDKFKADADQDDSDTRIVGVWYLSTNGPIPD